MPSTIIIFCFLLRYPCYSSQQCLCSGGFASPGPCRGKFWGWRQPSACWWSSGVPAQRWLPCLVRIFSNSSLTIVCVFRYIYIYIILEKIEFWLLGFIVEGIKKISSRIRILFQSFRSKPVWTSSVDGYNIYNIIYLFSQFYHSLSIEGFWNLFIFLFALSFILI